MANGEVGFLKGEERMITDFVHVVFDLDKF